MSKRKRILSGIQPSGTIHIGNYFGAVENWVRLMDEYDCFFTIVDLHASTVTYDPKLLQQRIWDAALDNMAAGLEPAKCTIFVQSHVPEHTELCWLLNCVTPLGELGRMTQFKEKSERERENVTAGLLNYPILRAADILIYKAQFVPVGVDQVPHLEMTREIARRFNPEFVFAGRAELGLLNLLHALGARVDTSEVWEGVKGRPEVKARAEPPRSASTCGTSRASSTGCSPTRGARRSATTRRRP